MRYVFSLANIGCADFIGSLKAENHSSEESQPKTQAQESKPKKTKDKMPKEGGGGGSSFKGKSKKNGTSRKPLDLTAESPIGRTLEVMRGRNSHSSSNPGRTKGSSKKSLIKKTKVSQAISNDNLRTFVQIELDSYKDKDERYNGIIRILANPGFLQFCYLLIKGKPGNMSRGITNETLDGTSFA